jgi:transcription initiation factor TFIIIB Brf1 subunit/transcription initiation factor TFIIB
MKDVLAKCDDNTQNFMFEATECAHLINRYVHNLKLQDKITKQRLIQRMTDINNQIKSDCVLECKTPSAITTGLVVYVSREMNIKEITKNNVSATFNVSVVTINKVVKIIDEYMKNKSSTL